ncbi:MAG TPA: protein kinase [Verrucomicrobiota bacterium]|nr:protein kinase [Verrucomicrobiota bacterium]
MNPPPPCPHCGRPLTRDAPGGLCLSCLAKLGVEGPPPGDLDATLVLPPPAAPGTIRYFGDYELIEVLGYGGMGVVFRARQVSLNRSVAIKMILHGSFASEEFMRRFGAEAQTVAQLRHPNIVGIHEVGEHEGQPYFSMEYVLGMTLSERVRAGPMPPREAARCVATVARAIQYAHDSGVLHRDLKPSNILLDRQGQPRVSDFGVAKRLDADAPITASGQILGTPAYISPEQIDANRGAVTVRSDVYSLGAVLYHVLTGRPPFEGKTEAEVFRAVIENEPPTPRARNREIPRNLETICLRCLAKEPARRYPSATALADDLERWLEGHPIQARPVSLAERGWLWAKRKPAIAALSAVLVATLALGFATVLDAWRVAERLRTEAEAYAQDLKAIVTRVKGEEAERALEERRSQHGIATLALALRLDPTHRIVASRLVSALSSRGFALPVTPSLADGSEIYWAGFSPGGRRILTMSWNNDLRLWDPATGEPVSPPLRHAGEMGEPLFSEDGQVLLAPHQGGALVFRNPLGGEILESRPVPGLSAHVALSPDGRTIAAWVTNGPGTVLLLDRQDPAARRELPPHTSPVTHLEFGRDGRLLAAGYADGLARIWAVEGNPTLVAQVTNAAPVNQARPSPDGGRLVTVHGNANVSLWVLPSGQSITNIVLPSNAEAVAFSPDSARIAIGTRDGSIRLLDAETGSEQVRRSAHTGTIYGLAFSPDSQLVASASGDTTVQVRDAHSGDLVCDPIAHETFAMTVDFSPDGQRLLTASFKTAAHLWDLRPGAALPAIIRDREPVRVVAFTPPPVELFTVSDQGAVRAWDPATGTLRRTIREPLGDCSWATFDPAARRVLIAETNSKASVLDLASGRSVPLSGVASPSTFAHAFSPDGTRVAVGDGPVIHVCETANGRRRWRLECERPASQGEHKAFSLGFSPDGRFLLAACNAMHARLWDVTTGAALADFVHPAPVASAEFNSDGTRILTAAFDTSARLWSVADPAEPLMVFRHRDTLTGARLSPDGSRVLTSTSGNEAFVWDAATGARLTPPMRHRAWVHRSLFSPDGLEVLTRSDDGTFRRWHAATGLPMSEPYVVGPGQTRAEVAVAPGWDWFAAGAGSPEVAVWREERWPLPVPKWLPELAEAVAGVRFEANGVETPVPATEFLRLKAGLTNASATDPWTRWAKWFLADRGTRTVAWDSELTVPAYVESLLSENTVDALRRAVRLAPTNAPALARLARATLADTNNPCRVKEAEFLSRRAVELAP